ncbi:melanoma inhibitory activity protein 2 [Pituophis catenifer annectens]|uniref:melanoma inhibitory activity protein 2 n=1 Tax=Pituophis catenifer annectens TaxID=94852 RepID=UPI003994D1B6
MLKILDISLTLLILSLSTNTKSTKVLSAQKKCGDSECETTMSRVLAIKDYTGPDCRYLSFKNGEEIMVYFKLSREREDLWAGSKGKDFGYFPMDAVQTEEAFVTEEIEVPTKETDFLCLDGEEYVFENEDSIFNRPAEENEHDVSLYTDGKDSDFNMPEDEIMKLPDTSIPKEYSSHSKTDQDDSSQQEDPIGQALNPVPTQSIWTVFGITGWLGLGGEEHKEAFGKSSEISEQITFRHRKIAIAGNADIQEQPKESKMEPRSSFQSSLTDLLHFGNEKSGHDLLYKDGDLDLHSSSNTASNSGHHGRTAASKARIEKHSDNELSESNWFGLKLNDILTFGYAQKDKEQLANGKIDQNEDPLPSNIKLVPLEDGLREAAVEQMLYEEQSKYVKKNIEQTLESVVDEEKEKYHEEMTSPDITDPEVPLGNECPDFMNTEAAAFSTELAENLKSSSTEQDSVSGNQINENTPNSERTKSQSDSVIRSEIQYSEAEELQCISSFSHYKDLFSFQNFPDKTINSLQEIKRTKVKNSQSKNSVESLQKNKELEKKNMLHQKTANLKENIFNKDIFLLSSTMQNNAGHTNVTKEARLLSETIFPSSEKHFSEYIIEPLFQDKKTCDKNFDKPHKTSELQLSLQRSTKQYKYVKRVSSSRKQYINKFKHLNLKGLDESTPVICYTDVMKKTEISEPLVCLYSQKYDIQEDVIVSHKENEFVEVKNVASMLPGTMKFFPVNYNEDCLQNKSITKESMNQFSQKRAKVEINVPKQILQLTIDSQQESKRMQTTEKYPNNLKQHRLSPFITGQELLPCEKEFYGLVKHNLNFVTHSMEKKYFQDPQMQIGERSNEVNSSERIEDYYDSAQSCDVSSVPKTIENYAPQEQTISHYPDSHTFSKKNNGKLPGNGLKEKNHLNSNNEAKNDQYSEKNTPPTNCKKKPNASGKKYLDQQDIKEVQENNLMNQSCIISNENERLLQIILDLNTFCAIITSIFSSMIPIGKKVVSSLPENMKPGPDLFGFSWEIVMVAIFTVLLFLCRMYKSVKSRLYLEREKQLASKIAELIEERCKLMEKLSLHKKEYAELENTLKDGSFLQESTIASNIKIEYEKLNGSNSALKNEIEHLEKELNEEKSKQSEQDNLMADIQKRKASLENEAKSIQFQVAEAKTTLKVHEINRERLKTSLQDAIEENRHLHESEKQLLQEAEGWNERFNELNEQIKMYESSQANLEEALKNKESQMKSLTDCLLRMKDWSCATGEHDSMGDNHKDNDIKNETENEQHLDIPEKETVKKLIYAAKLNAHLKSAETERNQIYSKLGDEKKAKEELAERIERLQKEHVILQSENIEVQNEIQKLQQKLQVMTELYQENEMNLHRKLTVEEKERLQKEEKLSKVDEKINHAAEEMNTYRHRVKDLEEELERTVRSYEKQINSHEKKAHDNWLTARAAERQLNDMRKENLHRRQNLTEIEFKHHLLKKDPYAYDDTATAFGREQSPYGPSPMGRPSSETRAFLSPPTLLEGPLRLSPVLPGGGGRGSRGLGNPGITEVGNERGELNASRLSDPHRPPSDTGSLSPPWDRDHRVILPHPGHLYNEQSLPFRRPERFYPNPVNSGRLSGPAELRSYNMHSVDKTDEPSSENNSRMDLSGDELRDHSNDSNIYHIHDQSLPPDNEILGPGIVPPPLPFLRAPLMSMDPRGSFMRRGPPFPPVPPGSVYGSQEYFPRDFAGLPRPLLPMRAPFPMRPFSQYPPPPRAGFFPPPPPPPLSDNRNEISAELTQLSTVSSTDNQESQQETG